MRFGKLMGLLLIICLIGVVAQAQHTPLQSGQAVEREIAGGESHTYQISLAAGQYERFRLDQRAIDATLILSTPDGKPLVEMNLTRAGDEESVSFEAAVAGNYRLTVQAKGMGTLRGAYRLTTNWKDAATALDKQRIAAESLMIEAQKLSPQAGKGAPQVIENLQKALPTWREQNEPSWEAWSLRRIGKAYSVLGRQDKAIEHLGQALSRYQAAKNRTGEGETLLDLGVAYSRLSQYEQAAEHNQKALEVNREAKNLGGEADALLSLGQVSNYQGFYEKGFEYAASAISISQEIEDRSLEARLIFVQGYSYLALSKFEKAIEIFERALAVSRELKNRSYEAAAYTNLGAAYANTDRRDKGIEYNKKALEIHREFGARPEQTNTLLNISNSYNNSGEYEQAVTYAEEALKISREIEHRVNEGRALQYLGAVYLNLRKYEKAHEYGELALQMARKSKSRNLEAYALAGLGSIYYQLKQFDKAVTHLDQALKIKREIKDQIGIVDTLHQIVRTEIQRGNLEQARTSAEEGIKIVESLRADLGSSEFRAAYLASVSAQGVYRLYTDVLMRQHRNEPTKGFDALAVETSERQRARSLLDLLAEANTDLRQGVAPALIEREQRVAAQLNDKSQQLARANKPEQAAALKQEVSQLENDYERAQTDIRKASPQYAALTQTQPLKLKEIQAQLDADTLLLEYALGEERSYVWAITKDALTSYELPKQEVIEQSARQVYELLQARSAIKRRETVAQQRQRIAQADAQLAGAAQALSQLVLAPVAAKLDNKRLAIVADGALQYVPFAMLPEPVVRDQGSGVSKTVAGGQGAEVSKTGVRGQGSEVSEKQIAHRPLIVGHEIVSLPSASALAIQRAELAGRQPAPKLLAVIADPVFDRTDARFTTPATENSDKAQLQTIAFNDVRRIEHLADKSDDKSGGTTRRLIVPRLPFTRQEATRLLALTAKNSSFGAMGFQANRTTVLSGDLSQYRYVHFATHGLLDTERPGLSALMLSMVDAEGKPQDGFLRANDIYNLKLPAELVVLSACQTGLGKEIKGEGLVGLTRGFMYAGAARVVVSLWSVNDKATAELMTRFYEKMLKQGARPAAALRAAQVEMWKQREWQSPYYWAAFTLQGEWK
jgi:CHAT domain-containing protein/uncharacterized protein HemY